MSTEIRSLNLIIKGPDLVELRKVVWCGSAMTVSCHLEHTSMYWKFARISGDNQDTSILPDNERNNEIYVRYCGFVARH